MEMIVTQKMIDQSKIDINKKAVQDWQWRIKHYHEEITHLYKCIQEMEQTIMEEQAEFQVKYAKEEAVPKTP